MACPLCRCERFETLCELRDRLYRCTDVTFHLARCARCGALHLSPAPSPSELAGFYPPGYWQERAGSPRLGRFIDACRRLPLFFHLRFLRRIWREQRAAGVAMRLLDAGCGDGALLAALGLRPALGLDFSAAALERARRRGLDVARADLASGAGLPLRSGCLSLVTLFHVLEHMPDPAALLRELRRALSPGGELVALVPNVGSLQARVFGAHWAGWDAPRHVVHFSEGRLRGLLAECGFEVMPRRGLRLRDDAAMWAVSLAPTWCATVRAARGFDGRISGWAAALGMLVLSGAFLPLAALEAVLGRPGTLLLRARPRHAAAARSRRGSA